uniref:FrhB_FdhB_C domain-containing protein n=1 Tax=Rhabditophanes sp. KR3021 TaxID=114890 RepID=A0AC35TIF6_9BILA
MPFAKQIAERYPNIKALGIGGVEKEESGKCFTDFTNLEVIIARSIKAQLIIPTSVRVVVQKIAAAKTNNDCIFIDQEDGSKITFNNICVFGVRRTNIDRKVYVRTIADLELYKEIHAFVETCLFDTDDTDLDTDNDVNEFGNYYDYYDEYDAMYNDSDGSDEFGLGYYHN